MQSRGRRHRGRLVTLLALTPTGDAGARIGLTVSRRVGVAVVRNRVRRRLREIVWALGPNWPMGTDVVVVAQAAAVEASFAGLRDEVARLLGRLRATPPTRPSAPVAAGSRR